MLIISAILGPSHCIETPISAIYVIYVDFDADFVDFVRDIANIYSSRSSLLIAR